jgi:PD-(D/E)XK nuclease superfamily
VEPPIIRTSERSAFGRCAQQWWWAYRDGLKAKRKPADALWFGIGIHEGLAEWYLDGYERGALPSETFWDWAEDEVRWIKANFADHDREWFEEPVYEEATELGVAMLDHYIEHYGTDPHWEVLAIEQPIEIELVKDDEVIAIFKSRLDGVSINHRLGLIVLDEHKTAGQIRTAHLSLDNQAGSYFAVATIVLRAQGILGKDEHIAGIEYNFLRKSRPDPRERDEQGRYLNKDGRISKKQPPPAFLREFVDRTPREVNSQLRRLTDEVSIMNMMRAGTIPVTKTVTYMCPSCPFYTMCVLHEKGGSAWREFRDANYVVENPYEDMRKSSSE